jgi:hypothetical protein
VEIFAMGRWFGVRNSISVLYPAPAAADSDGKLQVERLPCRVAIKFLCKERPWVDNSVANPEKFWRF